MNPGLRLWSSGFFYAWFSLGLTDVNKETKILVRCSCGKILKVLKQYAGKQGRCPQCGQILKIPEQSEVTKEPAKVCPACGAYLGPQDKVCISCHTDINTGEWQMVDKKRTHRFTPQNVIQYGIAAYILFSAVLLFYLLLHAKPKHEESNDVAWKIKPEQLQLIQKQYDVLEQKIAREKNPFRRWQELSLYAAVSQENSPRFQKKLEQVDQQILEFLRASVGELSQLIEEKRLEEILTRTTPRLLRMLSEGSELPSAESKQVWESLLRLYQQLTIEKTPQASLNLAERDVVWLEYYRKQFPDYLSRFQQWMNLRRYDAAQQELENLWEALHGLENISPQDALIISVRRKLKEVQAVKTLFSVASEEAKTSIGEYKSLLLKNGNKIQGKIVYGGGGHLELDTGKQENQRVALKELSAQDIVAFALSKKNNKYFAEYAGIFYYYERMPVLAKKSFMQASEYGADNSEIKHYLQMLQQTRDE